MWREIVSNSDFEKLFVRFDNFHESILREIYFSTPSYLDERGSLVGKPGSSYLRMVFQGGREDLRAIEMLALNPAQLNISRPGWSPYDTIEEAAYFFQEGKIFWSSDKSWTPDDGNLLESCFWYSCERLFWRDIDDGLGPCLHLKNQEEYDPELESILDEPM